MASCMESQRRTQALELRGLMSIIWRGAMDHIEGWLASNGHDITRVQLGVLRILHYEGPQTLSELSRTMALDPSTLVPTVDALQRRGLVQRERDPNDRRRHPISLLPEGHTLVDALPDITPDDPVLLGLDQLDAAQIAALLDALCVVAHHVAGNPEKLTAMQSRLLAHGAQEDQLRCKPLES